MNKLIIACMLIVAMGCAPAEETTEPPPEPISVTPAPIATMTVPPAASATHPPTPTEGTSPEDLANCPTPEAGTAVYMGEDNTYCVLLPEGWQANGSSFFGPLVTGGSEPIQVTIGLSVTGPADGRTLDQVVEESTEWMRNDPNLSLEQTTISLGGEPAELFKGVPGLGGDYYQWYMIHNETVYEGSSGPTGDLEGASEVFDTAFELFVRTLTWLD